MVSSSTISELEVCEAKGSENEPFACLQMEKFLYDLIETAFWNEKSD